MSLKQKMGVMIYLDTVLVPLSLFLTLSYHAYLWHSFKNKPSLTTIGINALRRREWFLNIKEGDDKRGMLAVQSLRNKLMDTILTATIAITMAVALAALTNNTYIASQSIHSPFLGLQSGKIYVLKFGSACVFLLVSFLSSSMAIAFLIDANFLINACAGIMISPGYTQSVFERGFLLALIGNRVLCLTFPLLLWMFGPLPVALSSVALVWGLYELDFSANNYSNKTITSVSLDE